MSHNIQICLVPFRFSNWKEDNYAYLLHDDDEDITIAIDPAGVEETLSALDQQDWKLDFIINTHHHLDHIGGNKELKEITGCEVIICQTCEDFIKDADHIFAADEIITIGNITLHSIALSGHTQSDICLYSEDLKAIFSGDLLFQMGCGRVGCGDYEAIYNSLHKLMRLPMDTMLFNSHDFAYTNSQFALSVEPDNQLLQKRAIAVKNNFKKNIPTQGTLLQEELDTNPFLRTDSQEIRSTLNLQNASNLKIFTKLRQLKNNFNLL